MTPPFRGCAPVFSLCSKPRPPATVARLPSMAARLGALAFAVGQCARCVLRLACCRLRAQAPSTSLVCCTAATRGSLRACCSLRSSSSSPRVCGASSYARSQCGCAPILCPCGRRSAPAPGRQRRGPIRSLAAFRYGDQLCAPTRNPEWRHGCQQSRNRFRHVAKKPFCASSPRGSLCGPALRPNSQP